MQTDTTQLTASEALYAFMGWLTSRREAVTFGASHEAATAAELVNEFCTVNHLAEPREDFHTRFARPPEAQPAATPQPGEREETYPNPEYVASLSREELERAYADRVRVCANQTVFLTEREEEYADTYNANVRLRDELAEARAEVEGLRAWQKQAQTILSAYLRESSTPSHPCKCPICADARAALAPAQEVRS